MKNKKKLTWWLASAIGLLISIGVYALVIPIEIVIGLIVMLFIHEMGHVLAAKRKGMPVSPPLFIPLLGAFIMMKRHPRDAVTEAYIAFGGPLIGTVGAMVAFLLALRFNLWMLLIVANLGFFLNLINLIPIHPLDGGRISVAVSRWLWLVGLIGGLFAAIYLASPLFFIVWALFAWELFYKFVRRKEKRRAFSAVSTIRVPIDRVIAAGVFMLGEAHQRELSFSTYSSSDGEQKVRVYWNALQVDEIIRLPEQGLVKRVFVDRMEQSPEHAPSECLMRVNIEYEQYRADDYYEVPVNVRWKYGFAYLALASFLVLMMNVTAKLQGYSLF